MPRIQTATRRIGRNAFADAQLAPVVKAMPVLVPDLPRKGAVPIKDVAYFMLVTALLCLFAFVAGRADVPPAQAVGVNAALSSPAIQAASVAVIDSDGAKE